MFRVQILRKLIFLPAVLKNHLFGLKCDLDHILFGTLSHNGGSIGYILRQC